jgi:hypothetical protein
MKRTSLILLLACPFGMGAAQTTWIVDSKPILDVTGVAPSGAVTFEVPVAATRLSNGSLLVADRRASAVRLIDAAGRLVKISGRSGQGPGEFSMVFSGARCGADSLVVWDPRARQLSMAGPSGVVARQFKIAADSGVRVPLMSVTCTSGGSIAYLTDPTGRRPGETPELMMAIADVITVDRNGRVLDRYPGVVGGEMAFTVSPQGGRGAFPRPLGVATLVAAVGDRVIIGVSDSARIVVVEPDGKRSTVALPITVRAPTREEFENSALAISSMAPNKPMADAAFQQISKVPMPRFAPAYSALFGDPDGLLWIQTSTPGAKRVDLLAVRLDGTPVARVQLPLPVTVLEIGRDYVLGSYTDANDEPHIAVWRIARK